MGSQLKTVFELINPIQRSHVFSVYFMEELLKHYESFDLKRRIENHKILSMLLTAAEQYKETLEALQRALFDQLEQHTEELSSRFVATGGDVRNELASLPSLEERSVSKIKVATDEQIKHLTDLIARGEALHSEIINHLTSLVAQGKK